jgi:hypothetical protein
MRPVKRCVPYEAPRPLLMERDMTLFNKSGEVAGTDILDLAVVAGSVLLLLATLWA